MGKTPGGGTHPLGVRGLTSASQPMAFDMHPFYKCSIREMNFYEISMHLHDFSTLLYLLIFSKSTNQVRQIFNFFHIAQVRFRLSYTSNTTTTDE